MPRENSTAGRATMISLVIHAGYLAVAVVWAVVNTLPRRPDASYFGSLRPAMEVALVALAEPPAAQAHPVDSEPRKNAGASESAALKPCAVEVPLLPEITSAIHTEPEATQPGVAVASPDSPRAENPSPGTATRFFGVSAHGQSVVFVIDRSASMGLHGRLERARRELRASLERLPPNARFQVIAYDRSAEPLVFDGRRGLIPAGPAAVAAAVAAVERLVPEGSTDHSAAIFAALALNPDVIYFLTDDDELTSEQVREATRRNRGRTVIHALCFVTPFGTTTLDELARRNRGSFTIVAEPR